MASFQRRGDAWRALIRRKGHAAISQTFDTKAEAESWARKIESGIDRGQHTDHRPALAVTLGECLTRYYNEVSINKKSNRKELSRIRILLDHPLSKRAIGSLRPDDFARYRDARLKEVAPATTRLELALISHLSTTANPIRMIAKPKVRNERDRRFKGDEEVRLFVVIDAIVVALETGMRQGELLTKASTPLNTVMPQSIIRRDLCGHGV